MNTDLLSLPLQPIHPWILLLGVKVNSQTSKDSSLLPELLSLPNAHFPISLDVCFFYLKCPVQAGLSLWSPDPSLRQPNHSKRMSQQNFPNINLFTAHLYLLQHLSRIKKTPLETCLFAHNALERGRHRREEFC